MVNAKKFAEEESFGLPYKIHVMGRNVLVTEGMKNYVIDKLSKLERFHEHIIDIHVTLDIQKVENVVTILMHWSHFKIKVSASATDMYASIDEATRRLNTKIRRWKEKIQDHSGKHLSVVDMSVNVLGRPYVGEEEEINEEIEALEKQRQKKSVEFPKIKGTETKPLKTLRTDEAIMKMELSDDHFMIFRDEVDLALKVIYRRSDGDYGIIRPH